jgi:hypothetical protein
MCNKDKPAAGNASAQSIFLLSLLDVQPAECSAATEHAVPSQQHDSAPDSNQETADVKTIHLTKSELGPDKPTNDSPDHAKHAGHYEPSCTTTGHKHPGNCASDQTKNCPRNNTHQQPQPTFGISTTKHASAKLNRHHDEHPE